MPTPSSEPPSKNPYREPWQLLSEKVAKLQRSLILETDASRQFKLDKQIEEEEKMLAELEAKMDDWDKRRPPLPNVSPEEKRPKPAGEITESTRSDGRTVINPAYILYIFGGMIFLFLLIACGAVAWPMLRAAMADAQTTPTQVATTPTLTNTPAETSLPTPTATASRISTIDGMRQLYVPGGVFLMGGETNDDDSLPQHVVYLDPFWMDETEVTNAMYNQCVLVGGCLPPSNYGSVSQSSYYGNTIYDNHPVIYLDWDSAKAYCTWAGRDLPTEAQWEKAARGSDGRLYPWGNESPTCELLNYNRCGVGITPVGSYPDGASPYGLLDMAGNVWEWTADWYDSDYYETSPLKNPTGPDSGISKVLRGGDWDNDKSFVHAAYRNDHVPTGPGFIVGFRCAQE